MEKIKFQAKQMTINGFKVSGIVTEIFLQKSDKQITNIIKSIL